VGAVVEWEIGVRAVGILGGLCGRRGRGEALGWVCLGGRLGGAPSTSTSTSSSLVV